MVLTEQIPKVYVPDLNQQQRRVAEGKYFLKHNDVITFGDTDEVFYFDGELWSPAEPIISKDVRESILFVNDDTCEADTREVIAYVRDMSRVDRGDFEPKDLNLVPLNNGVYDLAKGELRPYTMEDHFFAKLPVTYDPEAKCPNISKFLEEVCSIRDKSTLIEYAGYCLYRRYLIHKALILLGEGANGKTTFINLIKSFLGPENCSHETLQELNEVRFARAELYQKYANLFADLPGDRLFKTGVFKAVTGGDPISAERKFQNPFSFTNYAKLIFSANKLPATIDDTDAFFRRWLIVEFLNKFEGDKADKYFSRS